MSLTDPVGPGGGVDLSTGFGGATDPKPGDVLTRAELERLIRQEGLDAAAQSGRNDSGRTLALAAGGLLLALVALEAM